MSSDTASRRQQARARSARQRARTLAARRSPRRRVGWDQYDHVVQYTPYQQQWVPEPWWNPAQVSQSRVARARATGALMLSEAAVLGYPGAAEHFERWDLETLTPEQQSMIRNLRNLLSPDDYDYIAVRVNNLTVELQNDEEAMMRLALRRQADMVGGP